MASSCGKHASSLLLKDYLRDDLSSCSSSGFKSFPRRQCCTTVGFLKEKDLQLQRKKRNTRPRRRHDSSSFSTVSALQRASEAVMNAIKALPLSAKAKKGLLSRSLSRKLLSRRFWRKTAKEEESEGVRRRRTSFRDLIMEEKERDKTSSFKEDTVFAAPSFTASSGCDSNSWGESEFTFASTVTSSGISNDSEAVQLQGTKEGSLHHKIDGVTTIDWPNEKEQFSPVSILDWPFDEEECHKSHFNSTSTTCSLLEGAKHKHMQKRRHFKNLASLEPVALEKRFAWSELEDESHNHSTKQCSVSVPIMRTQNGNNNVRHHNIEENARDLLSLVKWSNSSNSLIVELENLLFDYFKQSIEENKDIDHSKKLHLCKVAEDWIHGEAQELYLGWEVQGGRCVYIREMDKCKEWKNYGQDIQHLVLELENEVFADLVNELLLD
ncbi:uncharacterized protein LOC113851142 [Abrus precatorius]|uniref:Uncharacterized protein LOC113851142 n=1 Tax=Abrus precatorius TaxID=3816 RepID=A0A8B8K0X4_ABRPR|nr:uncharacterized protein LOC113851142 [Abrus precatorius]